MVERSEILCRGRSGSAFPSQELVWLGVLCMLKNLSLPYRREYRGFG